MPLGLSSLPLELLRAVTLYLDLEDFFNLTRVSKDLNIALSSESTCKEVTEVSPVHLLK